MFIHGLVLDDYPRAKKDSRRKCMYSTKNTNKSSVDPFTRKEWYDIKAPSVFEIRNVGKTLVNRTQGLSKFAAVVLNPGDRKRQ